ncbi:MAG: hypothetical protein QXX41_14100 [Nitrososphaerota archaeon]
MNMVLIYEFWRYDIPTEVAKDLLEEFGIPYKEKVKRRKRDSLYGQYYDEWSKIYVKEEDLVKWLKMEIDRKILNYG